MANECGSDGPPRGPFACVSPNSEYRNGACVRLSNVSIQRIAKDWMNDSSAFACYLNGNTSLKCLRGMSRSSVVTCY